MGTRLFLLALVVPLATSVVLSKQGEGSRDRRVNHSEHERPPQKRSNPDGVKSVDPPEEVYQQEAIPLRQQDDSVPLYLMSHPPPPPSSFPVVAKVINEEGEKTREAMDEVKAVAGALLTMHSYPKGPQVLSQTEPGGYGAKKNKGIQQEEEECLYCPSGNCPYCRGKGGNGKSAEEYQQDQCPYCPSGKCPWCHGKGQPPQQNEEEGGEEGGEQCPNCPSGKCPWCHGKNKQAAQNNGRCPNCPSGKCPWCHGKNRQSQPQEEEEYEDDDEGQQQRCPNCPSGKCPWCHGKNNNNAAATKPSANTYSDYSKVQKGRGGGQMAQNEEEGQEQCPNCPSGRCPWCGGALTANGKCAGCPDGKCPWCQRNLETGEGPDGSPPTQRCPNCPSGKCPWCHGKNQQPAAQSAPTTYSAYSNQPATQNSQVDQEDEEEGQGQQQCPNCPSGRCPWCGGALTANGKCAGCPDGKCPWCHRNLQTGEGPDGSPTPNQNQGGCPNCPSGKCPWCHGKNQQQNADAPTQHQGYNNGQKGGCPYCPSGKCPWCHGRSLPSIHNHHSTPGKGQPPQQQPQTEVEYEYEDEPEDQTQAPAQKGTQSQNPQQWNQNQAAAQNPNQPSSHYGPPPGYQPQAPQTYANVQMPGEKTSESNQQTSGQQPPHPTHPTTQQQPQQEEYEYEEEEPQQKQQPQFGVNYGVIPSTGAVANYQAPGPAPTTPIKFRTGITSAVAPMGSMTSPPLHHSQSEEMPPGVKQGNGAGGCCVISLPPGRYQILPAAKAKARRKRSIENFKTRFLLRD
ncbi:hypothetical protein PENTCL1PPCAC_11251 [Pristionchus entomophagus]|uniref:Uncharacterized protein n=1 Tax=Pristionchus entomophagus TaxID=358040 RepID=A0AAV5TBR4_9BILA|nr:hypothetical protein PENTCL1PPCAC_11251 [Pristionchus entomophagus]